MRRHHILIPLAALLVVLPLILHGCSCGHDFDFHLQSWLDAATQLRHGVLYPRWAVTPAWNAGEPRFVFYPPFSWMLGAILSLLFPVAALPALYTWLILAAAGFAMYRCAVEFTSPNAALFAAILYLANPYMLFTAFERTAYAELLAAAWLPLLFLAALRKRPTIHGVAIPLALLWLTNAPAAVMGSYAFALLACFRFVQAMRTRINAAAVRATDTAPSPARLTITYILGTLLGLALPAFYLLPAAYERRYVQIAMAIIPNMRIQDNFLFGHTADAPHNVVLHTASVLAVTLLVVTFAVMLSLLIARPRNKAAQTHALPTLLLTMVLVIAFLLTPVSLPMWLHLPELAFLQFSWRLLTVLTTVFGLGLALLFDRMHYSTRIGWIALVASPLIALTLSLICIHLYRQPCGLEDTPQAIARTFATGHGVIPTDEYTPNNADNDVIRPNEPAYWLSDDPGSFAPNTTPNPGSTDPNFDGFFPPNETLSQAAPSHFVVDAAKDEFLIINRRDFPNWNVAIDPAMGPQQRFPRHVQRDDGLLTIPFPPGRHNVTITWRRRSDEQLGFVFTVIGLLLLGLSTYRSRKLI